MSGKVYYSYRNGAYELARTNIIFQERNPYGPAPLEEVLKLIEDINADPVQNPHWQRDVAHRLNQKHFRCTQILTAPRNEMGMSKLAYLFSKISSHPKLVILAIITAVLAPGYLVKNHPALALYLGSPTLRETANTIKDWFTTTRFSSDFFLEIIRKSLSNSVLPLYVYSQRNSGEPLTISGKIVDCQEELDLALFNIVRSGIFNAETATILSSNATLSKYLTYMDLSLSEWRFLIPDYNRYLLMQQLLTSGKEHIFLKTFINCMIVYYPHLNPQIHTILKETQNIDLSAKIFGLMNKERLHAKCVSRLLKPEFLTHFYKITEIIKTDSSPLLKGELLKEQIDAVAEKSAAKITDYFTEISIGQYSHRISKELKRKLSSPFFFKYISFLPAVKKVESIYKEFASLAKFSWIEWRLIGPATLAFGKNVVQEKKWTHLCIGIGSLAFVSFIAFGVFRRFTVPDFANWKALKLATLEKKPQDEAIRNLPAEFLLALPQITDYQIWHAIKKHSIGNHRTISPEWQADPVLQQKRCPIFGTPIRIPAKLKLGDKSFLTDAQQNILLFEDAHLQAWLNQQQSTSPIQNNLPAWWTLAAQQNIQDSETQIESTASDEIELRCLLLRSKMRVKKTSWERLKDTTYITRVFFMNHLLKTSVFS